MNAPLRLRRCSRILLAILGVTLALAGCSKESTERRAREAERKIKESIPDVVARALDQKLSAEQVKSAQDALTVLNEYQGEVNGELDAVTVNAIQAFQRSHNLNDDGILTEKTERLLKEASAKARGAQS